MNIKAEEVMLLIMAVTVLVAIVGWVANIIKLVSHFDGFWLSLIRCFGVLFAPLGAVLGFV